RDQFDVARGRLSNPRHLTQPVFRRAQNLADGAETAEQFLGRPLCIGPRNGTEKQHFEKLVVGERVGAGLVETRAQPLAVSLIVLLHPGLCGLARRFRRRPQRPFSEKAPLIFLHHRPANPPRPESYEERPGRSSPAGDRVKISQPSSVTPTECSYCAESERSRVTAVQPSDRTFTWGRPRLIIGSMVKIIPGRISTPSLGLP